MNACHIVFSFDIFCSVIIMSSFVLVCKLKSINHIILICEKKYQKGMNNFECLCRIKLSQCFFFNTRQKIIQNTKFILNTV